MEDPIAAPLRALLSNLIDYAGLYPPAALPLPIVRERYRGFLASPDAWILNRLVLPFAKLREASTENNWRITLLVEDEPGPLPRQVETLEVKLPHKLSLPTYCEAPIGQVADAYIKVRTGGLKPEAIPSTDAIADFLVRGGRAAFAIQGHRRSAPSAPLAAPAHIRAE